MIDVRLAWFARLFVSSLPSPWCWPQSTGLGDFSGDERWARYGESLLSGNLPITTTYPEEFARAKHLAAL